MRKRKFKNGDICRVVKRNKIGGDRGSEIRDNFIIIRSDYSDNGKQYLYWPEDDKQGAYEEQLELQRPKTLKEFIKNGV